MSLKIGGPTGMFVCNLRPKHPASSWMWPWSDKWARPADKCMCRTSCTKMLRDMTRQ